MKVETLRTLVADAAERHPELGGRLRSAAKLALFDVQELEAGIYFVTSERDSHVRYRVEPNAPAMPHCSYQFARFLRDNQREPTCKHELAVGLYRLVLA